MASPSESRNMTSEDAEVTSEHRNPEPSHRQLVPPEERDQAARRELDLEFPLMRQTSIYSLTLDEIQNAVCEPGKTFGSMNMDEFLTNIWNVEEVQAAAVAAAAANEAPANNVPDGPGRAQPLEAAPLRRQGSLTLPAPLSRKTVDEVWTEIHRDAALRSHHVERAHPEGAGDGAPRQPTFGEMTLEDFLVKAGVVREGYGGGPPVAPPPHAQPVAPPPAATQQYGMAGLGHVVSMAGYVDQQGLGTAAAAGVGSGGYPVGNGFGGRMGNGYSAAAAVGSPASPVSSDGMGGGQVDNSVAGYIADGSRGGGGVRKRPADGAAVDKVVERRQRRMIKNRESAARSRARKQAYTVELEAELNQLKEENARLREEQRRVMALRKQLLLESMSEQARINVQNTVRKLRRCNSSMW